MDLSSIEQLLVAILPAGVSSIAVALFTLACKFLNTKLDKKVDNQGQKIDQLLELTVSLAEENRQLKKTQNKLMAKMNNCKFVEDESNGEKDSI